MPRAVRQGCRGQGRVAMSPLQVVRPLEQRRAQARRGGVRLDVLRFH